MKLDKNNQTPIFLLGSGRSGTTLIQRLLNSYDDTMIWGEHHGFLSDIANSYFLLKNSPSMKEFSYEHHPTLEHSLLAEHYKQPEIWQAWINWFNKDDLIIVYQKMIESFFNQSKIGDFKYWGFKEIRYGQDPIVINFLLELYPHAKFVIITRNGLNTIESQLTTFHRGNSRFLKLKRLLQLPLVIKLAKEWAHHNRYYAELISKKSDAILHINYDKISEENYLIKKFECLDKPFSKKQIDILNLKSGRGSAMKDSSSVKNRWERMGAIPIFFANLYLAKVNKQLS